MFVEGGAVCVGPGVGLMVVLVSVEGSMVCVVDGAGLVGDTTVWLLGRSVALEAEDVARASVS